jgi:hypothetical protein
MDAVMGTVEYKSELGVFAKSLRASQLPRKHETFFDLIQALDIRGYVCERTAELVFVTSPKPSARLSRPSPD